MIQPLVAIFAAVVFFAFGTFLGSKTTNDHQFKPEQCTTAPTGRMHKNVVAVQADEGKPVGVVETVTAIEYMTVCEKSEWRK